jgi:hypothetical protein
MDLIRIGDRIINVDCVTQVHYVPEGRRLAVYFVGGDIQNFEDDEAAALYDWFVSKAAALLEDQPAKSGEAPSRQSRSRSRGAE